MTDLYQKDYDCHLNCHRFIHEFIEAQFPMIYRENGRELIAFLEHYFTFEEITNKQFLHESNCLPEKDDIDTTPDGFVKYFTSKYMKNMPFNNSIDNRFILKNILDLYQAKGTERGLRLLMQLICGDDEVDVYYPGQDVLRPSHSIWYQPRYLELSHSPKTKELLGKRVYGNVSGAEAYVDSIVTKRINGRLFDVVYLSDVRGAFNHNEYITDQKGIIGFGYPYTTGSLTSISIPDNSTYGYSVGDIVDIKSATGDMGIARVTSVEKSDVRVSFNLQQLGYGYAATAYANGMPIVDSITEIDISDSILEIANSNLVDGDTLTQYFQTIELIDPLPINAVVGDMISYGAYQSTIIDISGNFVTIEGSPDKTLPTGANLADGVVINNISYDTNGVTNNHITTTVMESSDILVWGYDTVSSNGMPSFYYSNLHTNYAYDQFGNPYEITRVLGGTGANFEIVTLQDEELITLNTDIIGSNNVFGTPYLDLTIDSADYGFPNPNNNADVSTLNTVIDYALSDTTTTIGSAAFLSLVNPGTGYQSDIKVRIQTPVIMASEIYDVIMKIPSSQGFAVGQTITQGFATGRVLSVDPQNDLITVRPTSYMNRFRPDRPITVDQTGQSYIIEYMYRDTTSRVMGDNMVVTGRARAFDGQISGVEIVSSGFGFRDNEPVTLMPHNTTLQTVDAIGYLGGAGISAGTWKTHTSHLNWSTYIHDNYYYQEYSYDIKASCNPDKYIGAVEDITHVAGNELFTTPVKRVVYDIDYKFETSVEFLGDGFERYVTYGYSNSKYSEEIYTGIL